MATENEPITPEARAEAREEFEAMAANITADQLSRELMETGQQALQLKVDIARLRRNGDTEGADRLVKRAVVVDIPDLINELATRTAGAVLALDYFIDQATQYVEGEEEEYEEEEYEEEEYEEGEAAPPSAEAALYLDKDQTVAMLGDLTLRKDCLSLVLDHSEATGTDAVKKAAGVLRRDLDELTSSIVDLQNYAEAQGWVEPKEAPAAMEAPEAPTEKPTAIPTPAKDPADVPEEKPGEEPKDDSPAQPTEEAPEAPEPAKD